MTALDPTPEAIAQAARALRRGELVGMPTETVYGVAAIAGDAVAVRRVFAAKGRPAENPLIVHVLDLDQAADVAREISDSARRLGERFWPGPLTLVLPKAPGVPEATTGGLGTVAIRAPAHPVARALIEATSAPLAAPSANRFMGLSPTRAEDIDPEIAAHLSVVLDGGACEVGVESTVLDLTGDAPVLLRPGGVSRAEIERFLRHSIHLAPAGSERRSPGAYLRHYAPRASLRIAARLLPSEAGLVFDPPCSARQIRLPNDPEEVARRLYAELRRLDREGPDEIVVQAPPDAPEWEAIWDRLRRAAHPA